GLGAGRRPAGRAGGAGHRRGRHPVGSPVEEAKLILYGRHPVLEALRSGGQRVEEVLVEREAGRGLDVVALARKAGVRCSPAPRAALTALAGTHHHQGVVARVAAWPYAELEAGLAVPPAPGQ